MAQMRWLNQFKKMLPEVIRCDEQDYLIWKWHPQDLNGQDNKIIHGSQLRVRQNEAAIFFCRQTNGCIQEIFEGPCDVILETENFPMLSEINTLFSSHAAPAPAEVYFVNRSEQIIMRFGVPYFKIKSEHNDSIDIAVRGNLFFHIPDIWQFVSLYGLQTMWIDDLKSRLKDRINLCVKDTVKKFADSNGLSAIKKDSEEIRRMIAQKIQDEIGEHDGLRILNVVISEIEAE